MGNAINRFHRNILTLQQRKIWRRSASLTSKWGSYLAGGTAVALYLGHRRSEDFDWFTPHTLAPDDLLTDVARLGFPVTVRQNTEGTFLASVAAVSFSVFRYRYPLLGPLVAVDGCALASIRDLSAMKLLAIYQRGTKKDFIDVHAILKAKRLTLADIFAAFREKYAIDDTRELFRALVYFEDAEVLPMPHMLAQTTWEEVKKDIVQSVKTFEKPRGRRW
jgi:hypothetical protein